MNQHISSNMVDASADASIATAENSNAASDPEADLPASSHGLPDSTGTPQASAANDNTVLPTASEQAASAATDSPNLLIGIIRSPAFLMIMSVFLFSVMVLCVKMASRYYSNFEIISFRGFIGVACLLIYQQIAHGHGITAMKTPYLGMQMWRSFIGTMSMTCWFYGIAILPLATATTLSYMSSIWMALFIIASAMITGKGKPDFKLLLTIVVGFGGIVLILRPTGDSFELWASLVVLLSSVFAALAYLQVAALGRMGEPEYRTVFYFCLFGAIFGLVCTLFNPNGFSEFSWPGIAWMIPVGVTAMAAQLLLTRAYTQGNALVNASLQYLGLVFVILFDWILGTGWPDQLTWIGMALVVLSGLLATILRSIKIPHALKHADKHHH